MHPLMKHREKWGPHSQKWPQPISLSFSNVFSNFSFNVQSKTAWWFWRVLAQCLLFMCVWRDRELPACLSMTREWLWRLPAWGEKMRCYSQWRHTAEKSWRRDKNVSIHANWCPDPPRGCHRLLSGEGIKGPFTTHEHFHVFHPGPLPFLPTFSPARCN